MTSRSGLDSQLFVSTRLLPQVSVTGPAIPLVTQTENIRALDGLSGPGTSLHPILQISLMFILFFPIYHVYLF